MKKTTLIISPLACLLTVASANASYFVPATSDPWLAGAANGALASGNDHAPDQSPVLVTGIAGGQSYQFSVTGRALNTPGATATYGDLADGGYFQSHDAGTEYDIASVNAPINSLIGVFLPTGSGTAASMLDFSTIGLNFTSLFPELNQPFFIGDGLAAGATAQTFVAPTDATRLFLGTMDGYEWNNNSGGFNVNISAVPEPSTVIAGALLLLPFGVSALRKLRNIRA